MKANPLFLKQPKEFWAYVRIISQEVGYTRRGNKAKKIASVIRIPTLADVRKTFKALSLSTGYIADDKNNLTEFGELLFKYFEFRADVLNTTVQRQLMDKSAAEKEFKRIKKQWQEKCPLPMNKQKGVKKNHAFLTGMINMMIEANIGDAPCDYDPRSLTTITLDAMPLRTLSRRVDGAFPSTVDPIAIW